MIMSGLSYNNHLYYELLFKVCVCVCFTILVRWAASNKKPVYMVERELTPRIQRQQKTRLRKANHYRSTLSCECASNYVSLRASPPTTPVRRAVSRSLSRPREVGQMVDLVRFLIFFRSHLSLQVWWLHSRWPPTKIPKASLRLLRTPRMRMKQNHVIHTRACALKRFSWSFSQPKKCTWSFSHLKNVPNSKGLGAHSE